MILGLVPLSLCRVECDRRRTAKLTQSSPSGSKRGWMQRRRTLSGKTGLTVSITGSKDRAVDPIESQRLQARMDAAAQNVVRQERRYNPLARKRPPLIVPLRQIRDPGY